MKGEGGSSAVLHLRGEGVRGLAGTELARESRERGV